MAESKANAGGGKRKQWFPLESNPAVMNPYIQKLGFPAGKYEFCDVLSCDDWALAMVPQPVLAVMLLFPIKPSTRESEAAERERIDAEGQTVDDSVFFTKQTIGNACGTIGLLHSVANSADRDDIELTGWFKSYLENTADKTPDERAAILEENDELDEAHEETANEGQSEVNEEVSQNIDTHFIAFVHKAGALYELDGRKPWPVNHGASTPETLLTDACNAIREKFMGRDPGEMRFAITALAGKAQ